MVHADVLCEMYPMVVNEAPGPLALQSAGAQDQQGIQPVSGDLGGQKGKKLLAAGQDTGLP